MRNRVHEETDARQFLYANAGAAILALNNLGKEGVVRVGNRYGVAHVDIASGASGIVYTAGTFKFCKQSADVFTQGQTLGWDAANKRVTTDTSAGVLGTVEEAAGDGTTLVEVMLHHGDAPRFAAAQVAASAAVSATTTPTKFDKQHTIPANTLRVGDVVRVRAQAIATATNSTDTLNLKAFLGALEIAATGAVDVANGDIGYFDFDAVVRTVGGSGTVVAAGVKALGVPGTVMAAPFLKASATLDTTVANAVAVEATWSTNNAGNSCRLDVLDVQVIRPGSALA